jgi:hypothetical protein
MVVLDMPVCRSEDDRTMGTPDEVPEATSPPVPRFVLDTGRRCTICLAPLFGDPGSMTINKSISTGSDAASLTLSFPVCTVCVDPAPPHTLRLDRWKIARPGPEMSISVFEHRTVIRELLSSGVDSYFSRTE